MNSRLFDVPSLGIDAIQTGVKAMPPVPAGKRVTGYGVSLEPGTDLYRVTVYVKKPGKRTKTVPNGFITVPYSDVGEAVYAHQRFHVYPTQEMLPTLADVRKSRLLQANGKDNGNA